MRSFSLLDTYDPSANSTRYPYKESILMISPADAALRSAAVCLGQYDGKHRRLERVKASSNRQRPAGACPGRSGSDCPDAVWSANRDGLVAAAVARCGRALLLEALAAVNRLVVPRLEGDFRLLAAGRADGRIHLAGSG